MNVRLFPYFSFPISQLRDGLFSQSNTWKKLSQQILLHFSFGMFDLFFQYTDTKRLVECSETFPWNINGNSSFCSSRTRRVHRLVKTTVPIYFSQLWHSWEKLNNKNSRKCHYCYFQKLKMVGNSIPEKNLKTY